MSVGRSRVGHMETPQQETEPSSESDVRFYKPGEPLPAGGEEALNRRSVQEHQDAIDRALRRK